MYAFLSYQTDNKEVAGRIRSLLESIGVNSFLAHEDIQVSDEWRAEILKEIAKVDVFIAVLSSKFYASSWCVQETGIAAYREDVTIIPLSVDGAIPQGFIAHIQSIKIDPKNVSLSSLLPGLAKRDVSFVIETVTGMLRRSSTFRGAEADFQLIAPYLPKATKAQMIELLNVASQNSQVLHATRCVREYLPPIFESHGRFLDDTTRSKIAAVLAENSSG